MATLHNPIKLLVVEDDPGISETLRIFLGEEGYDVVLAKNGVEALRQITRGVIPALIIADIRMPAMDGFQLCQAIRRNPALSNSSFLFLTALTEPDNRLEAYRAGADDLMTKPFELDDLKLKVSTLLGLQIKNKPQAIFCSALNGVATWMLMENSETPKCLNKGQCDPSAKKKSCTLVQV